MHVTHVARRLVVLGSLTFSAVGVAVVLPGALLPLLIERLDLRISDAGLLLATQPLGHLCAVLLLPRALPRVESRWLLACAGVVLGSAVAALGAALAWNTALLAMAVSGLGIGVLEIGTNTVLLVNTSRPNRVLNFTHLFFGVASVLTPPLAAAALENGVPWSWVWIAAGTHVAITGLLWGTLAPPLNRSSARIGAPRMGARRSIRWPKIALAAAMAAYVGAEIGFGSWYTKYFTLAHGGSLVTAGHGLAIYWGGLTVGRFLLALWAPGHSSVPFVAALGATAALTASLALVAQGASTFVFFAGVLGVALAGIFPGILALAARWYPGQVATVTGMLLAGAGVGQMLFPWAMALIAERLGVPRAMWVYPLLCASVSTGVLWGALTRSRQCSAQP